MRKRDGLRWVTAFVGALVIAGGAAWLAAGCSGAPSPATPAARVLDVMLQGGQLTVLGQYASASMADADASAAVATDPQTEVGTLDWQFVDASGAILAAGTVKDTRVATSEFDDRGNARAVQVPLGFMIFSVKVPAVSGTLRMANAAVGLAVGQPSLSLQGIRHGDASASTAVPWNALPPDSGAPAGVQRVVRSIVGCPINLLIVPEAYTDMDSFHTEAQDVVEFISGSEEYGPHRDVLQFWTQDFVSHGTAIHQSPTSTEPDDTAFNTQFGGATGDAIRRAITSRALPAATATALVAGARFTNADIIVTLVNTTEYGGVKFQFAAGSGAATGLLYVTTTKNSGGNRVIVHELGHGLLSLADEYSAGTCNIASAETINTSAQLMNLPWKGLVTLSLPSSGSGSGVGAFEGADYCATGVYRPAYTCLMRELPSTWCPVCKRQYESVFGPRDVAADAAAPASMDAGGGTSLTGSAGGSSLTVADASSSLVKGSTGLLGCPSKLTR